MSAQHSHRFSGLIAAAAAVMVASPTMSFASTFGRKDSNNSTTTPTYSSPTNSYRPAPVSQPQAPRFGYRPSPQFQSAPQYRPAPSYQRSPEYRPAPTYSAPPVYRPAPSYQRAPDYHSAPDYRTAPKRYPNQDYQPSPGVQHDSSWSHSGVGYHDPSGQPTGGVIISTNAQDDSAHLFGGALGHTGNHSHHDDYSNGSGHINLPPSSGPNIIVDQPNLYRYHHEEHHTVIVNNVPYYDGGYYGGYYPGYYPPYFPCYPSPTVVYVPDPTPQVVYVPQEPQVIYVPQQPEVLYVPESTPTAAVDPNAPETVSSSDTDQAPVVIVQDGASTDSSASGGDVLDVPGGNPPLDDGRAVSAVPAGAARAIVDIQEAWLLSDDTLIKRHLDPAHAIRMYLNGKLDFTASTTQYLDLTHKALQQLATQSFVLNHRSLLADGRVKAWGTQVFTDPDNHRQTNSVCYWLQPVDGKWVITAVNTVAIRPSTPDSAPAQ